MPAGDLKVVTLPEHDEMLKRVAETIEQPHIQRDFANQILQHAGEQKNAFGVVLLIQLCIHDATEGLPLIAAVIMQGWVKPLIEALVDDEEVRAEALRIYDEVKSA